MPHPDLPAEQEHLDEVYAHLDAARRRDQDALRTVMLDDDPEPQARVEREVEYQRLQANLERYRHAEVGLVFGRIDVADDEPDNPVPGAPELDRRYIGRMGLSDADDDYRSLLMDWRAPQARPFYLATTAHPEGVTLRRHLRTRGRTVRAIDDERLTGADAATGTTGVADARGGDAEGPVERRIEDGVGGEAVLREVIDSARTGHMRGIVETIQREQDLIIRDNGRGAMVVQGGPGTGKTAVALHRVAWLLYTHRDQLAKTGVLILGPNTTFLEYISRVLPSLGETGVVLRTIADLYPGVSGTGAESQATREVKGSAEMVHILRQAVRDRQPDPDAYETVTLDGVELTITPAMIRAARTRARRSRKPHNLARPLFREHLLESLARALADRIGADPLGGENLLSITDVADLRDELDADEVISGLLDDMWPELTPEQLLVDLLESEDRIAAAAVEYDDATRAALLREPGTPMGPSDPPLLDELAELLGGVSDTGDEREWWRRQIEEAQDALDILTGSAHQELDDETDAEILMAYDLIDAEALAERHRDRDVRSTADRAAEDREWTYGHVIVDEAQELSAMAWRMIRRRSPNGWMTIVGDIAQTGSPAGAESWDDALGPIIGDRWRMHRLTINYRTPSEIMDVAADVLSRIAPNAEPPRSIRSTGRAPVRTGSLSDALAIVRDASDDARLTAVIAPAARVEDIRARVECPVHDVDSAKGLEFDEVILVDPDAIVAESPQGLQDLYVALTRATQGLTVVADGQPESLPPLDPAR
ncbi:ATP-binding domain-containing protein [Corynebacterium sp. HMSC11E11]|uniref:HelD family protein n=1 Tax=Corynebacterium sp. HMSC11E11 TaxID=1581089 RepID=UPI000B15ED59|nr:ATP-binding domain-containing protein [Corynebacterium sp. HMSC11E11]